MKLQEIFLIESPVIELEKNLKKPHSYDAIDHLMTGISNKHGITPKELHDEFVKQHGKTPDEWISEITEAPLVDIEPLGDFERQGGFRGDIDKRIATNPAVHARAKKFFSRSPYDFRIYPINVPGGSKFLEKGEVTMDWLQQNLPVAAQKLQEVPQTQDEIVVFFTSNTGVDKVPLTPWMMAHRFGHSLNALRYLNKNSGITTIFNEIERELALFIKMLFEGLYNKPTVARSNMQLITTPMAGALFANIGTMRSARSTEQYKRPYEFIYEMFAQYLNTGSIKFNPLPDSFRYGKPVFGRRPNLANAQSIEDVSDWNLELETLGRTLEYYFGELLTNAAGNIYVM